MALPNINFTIENGGLARAGLNEDITMDVTIFG